MIYEKSTRALLREMVASWDLQPGQVFTSRRTVDWFAERYPKLNKNTVTAHLTQASTNNKSRLNWPTVDDLLFQVDRGQYRLYEPGVDPAPIREMVDGDVAAQQEANASEDDPALNDDPDVEGRVIDGRVPTASTEFLLERDLQLFLAKHLDRIEPGLKLYEQEGVGGLEFDAGGRRIDILAIDAADGLVVIELKVSKGYDRVVGQLLRYVNWIKIHVAESGQRVRGIIVCRTMSEDLRMACAGIPDVELYEYQLSVTVSRIDAMSI